MLTIQCHNLHNDIRGGYKAQPLVVSWSISNASVVVLFILLPCQMLLSLTQQSCVVRRGGATICYSINRLQWCWLVRLAIMLIWCIWLLSVIHLSLKEFCFVHLKMFHVFMSCHYKFINNQFVNIIPIC